MVVFLGLSVLLATLLRIHCRETTLNPLCISATGKNHSTLKAALKGSCDENALGAEPVVSFRMEIAAV